jgi:toxin ParE1/3/4
MPLRWTEEAAADLKQIADYLFEKTQLHAERTVLHIYEAPQVLLRFPLSGRPGRKKGTRELVFPSLPYVLIYKISGDVIHIVRILHGAQKYP